ncbi:MAG: hypothetical protein JWO33_132 [Caulobacteraceae bacterium]|nr:hypothetical protein [Caulobacteraceae bacterium]
MNCEICRGPMAYDFSKTFDLAGLGRADYWRCQDCGFLISRTHADLSQADWEQLNSSLHATYQGSQDNPSDPRWMERIAAQAQSLAAFARRGLIPAGRWLDYGCGDGALTKALAPHWPNPLSKYDQYMRGSDDYLPADDLRPGTFDFVITTSVFEHLLRREQWDAIDRLVAPRGVLGLHTLIREAAPRDPGWFYLQPPHTAFFSNAAAARLFADWGYVSSLYDVEARLWLWFREDIELTAAKVAALNATRAEPVAFAAGFVDYWK